MQIIEANKKIKIQNIRFTGITKPVNTVAVEKNHTLSLHSTPLKNLSPAYFHPSFASNPTKVKEFESLLDLALENSNKITNQMLERLQQLLKNCAELSTEKFINHGRSSRVYKLGEKYVVKVPIQNEGVQAGEFKINSNPFLKELKSYHGEEIATCGNVSILKNADPKNIALPLGAPFSFEYSRLRAEDYYMKNDFLSKLLKLPQKAFDEIATDFQRLNEVDTKILNKEYLHFDCYNPNNFLLVGDKIKITDVLNSSDTPNQNNIGSLALAFILKINAHLDADYDRALVPQRKELLKKLIIANERAELSLDMPARDIGKFDKALFLCDINTPDKDIFKKLHKYRNRTKDIDRRIEKVKRYLDKLN